MALRYLDDGDVQINARRFRMGLYNPPFKDGNTHLVEATSDLTENRPHLQVAELKGLLGSEIPKGFQLILQRPEARTKGLDFATFENLLKGPRITVDIKYYYEDWDVRRNVFHFAQELSTEIESKVKQCQEVRVKKDEYGVSLGCSFYLEAADDCYEMYSFVDRSLNEIYKRAIEVVAQDVRTRTDSGEQRSDHGSRWWIRYVVVPIVSGGAGAALIGWLVAHLAKG